MNADLPSTIADAAVALRSGALTSVELTRSLLARADAHDSTLGTYVARFDDAALAAAAKADADFAAGVDRGPLQGIPLGVKDIIAAREGATTACSKVLDPEWGRGVDAPVVARLPRAGRGHHREDRHDGVRHGRARCRRPVPDPPQPVGPRAVARRVEFGHRNRRCRGV